MLGALQIPTATPAAMEYRHRGAAMKAPSETAADTCADTAAVMTVTTSTPPLKRAHLRRLREIFRSAGWPCADMIEVELLAAGCLERCVGNQGHETLRVTDAGIQALALAHAGNKTARDPHECLVKLVADQLAREGRLAWRGLMLRAPLSRALACCDGQGVPAMEGATTDHAPPPLWEECKVDGTAVHVLERTWCMAMPDVFSIRRSSVEAYLEPVVHEIKVTRSDLLGDLRKPAKRAAYLAMAGAVWYVLGEDAKGRPIPKPEEVPPECGVLQLDRGSLVVTRSAPRRSIERLPFHVWMALAQAGPHIRLDSDEQAMLPAEVFDAGLSVPTTGALL